MKSQNYANGERPIKPSFGPVLFLYMRVALDTMLSSCVCVHVCVKH